MFIFLTSFFGNGENNFH